MLKEMLIDPFLNGDWLFGVFFWVLFLGALFLFVFIAHGVIDEIRWSKVKAEKYTCKLLSQKYESSTLETNPVPVVTGSGVGVGVVTTGEDEKYITIWTNARLGRFISDNENVFRWAKNESELWIKVKGNELRVVGIEIQEDK